MIKVTSMKNGSQRYQTKEHESSKIYVGSRNNKFISINTNIDDRSYIFQITDEQAKELMEDLKRYMEIK